MPYDSSALKLVEKSIKKKQDVGIIPKNINKNEISGHPYKIIKQNNVNFY